MKKIISILLATTVILTMGITAGAALAPTEYEYTDIASDQNNYVATTEMYTTGVRKMTTQYGIGGGGRTDQSTSGTTILFDENADGVYDISNIAYRYVLTGAGKSGDKAFMNYGVPVNGTDNGGNNPGTQYLSFVGYVGSNPNRGNYWDMPDIVKDKVYQFTLRAKAPAYVTDATMSNNNVLYVDKATGSVKVKSSMTNGMIGAPLSFRINTNKQNPNIYSIGTFTGYLDGSGNYVPFTAQGAEYTAPLLQSEYVDYVGYFKATGNAKGETASISQDTIVSVGNDAEGIWYVDEISVKEMAYTNGNLAQNGNFTITSGTQAFLYEGSNATVVNDATHGNILNVAQGTETKEVPVVGMTQGTEYTISFYAKSAAEDGTAYANIITDSVSAELKDDTKVMTAEWQKYEFDFTYNGGSVNFSLGSDCTDLYSIADIRILPKSASINNKFTDISISGDLIENHTVSVNYTYVTNETPYFIVKISRGNDSTGYTSVFEEVVNGTTPVNYTVSSADVGKKLLVEVFAMGDTMTVSKIVSDIVAPELSIIPEFTGYNAGTRTLSAKVTTINNSATDEDVDFFVALAVYDASECKVCNTVYLEDVTVVADSGTNVQTISATIPNGKIPANAELFVWSGSNIYDADMTALTDVLIYNFQ